MSIQDEQDVQDEDRQETAAAPDGAAEFDERRAKMERLRADGIDPYPPVSLPDRTLIKDVLAAHDPAELSAGEHPELRYRIAGRLISRRGHGKTAFLDVRDLSGSIQVVVRYDAMAEKDLTTSCRWTSATSSPCSAAST